MNSKVDDMVSMKKVVTETLGEENSSKYFRGISIAYESINDIYEQTVQYLIKGNTEMVIKCLIFALDINRNYKPLLNLSRTMLWGLGQKLDRMDYEDFKSKYGESSKAKKAIKKKVKINKQIIKKELKIIKQNQFELDNAPSMASIFKYLAFNFGRKEKLLREVKASEKVILSKENEFDELKKRLEEIKDITIVEEYVNIMRIVIEVRLFPDRFVWAK